MRSEARTRRGPRRAHGLAFLLALPMMACNATGRPLSEVAPEINASLQRTKTVLGPDDLLAVRFVQNPSWNHETPIQPDGHASFVGLGSVQAGGLTVEQLAQRLTELYARILAEPQLTVVPRSLAPRSVAVLGEVGKPGTVAIGGEQLDLLEAFARVGGHDRDSALLKNVLLLRWDPGEQERRAWHIDARAEHWALSPPVPLQPFDIVYVPPKNVVRVNTWVQQYIRDMIPFPRLFVIEGGN